MAWGNWESDVDRNDSATKITIDQNLRDITWTPIHLFCLMGSGPEDNVAEYYQQQAEMLEGFNEMDELTERGSLHRMSKVHKIIFIVKCL